MKDLIKMFVAELLRESQSSDNRLKLETQSSGCTIFRFNYFGAGVGSVITLNPRLSVFKAGH